MNRRKILIPIIIATVAIILIIIYLSPKSRYNDLIVNQNQWDSITGERNENLNIKLADIEFNDYNLIIDEEANTLYYSMVNESKTKNNPIVSFKTNNKNDKIAILSNEITTEKSQNRTESKIMIYNQKEYHIYTLVCTNLPLLNISLKEEMQNKPKSIPMEIYLFNNLSNTTKRITISSGRLRQSGNNYAFSLNMKTPGENIRENKISIFNMKPNSEYILTATNKEQENAQQNNLEANSLNTNNGEIIEKHNHPVELFINSKYVGLYLLGHKKIGIN